MECDNHVENAKNAVISDFYINGKNKSVKFFDVEF